MRVAFPINGRPGVRGDWTAARPGGADHSTLTLAVELARRGLRPAVIVHQNGPTVDYVEHLGLDALVLDFAPVDKRAALSDDDVADIARHAQAVAAMLSDSGIDIVHTNDAGLHRTWGILRTLVDFRHVWHERGLFQHPALSKEHLAKADAVLSISDFVRRRAPDAVIGRVRVIDNPVRVDGDFDPTADATWLRSEFELPDDCRIFTMIANGNKRKRWDLFFLLLAIMSRRTRTLDLSRLAFRSQGTSIGTSGNISTRARHAI